MDEIKSVEKLIGVRFHHKDVLRRALTHYSCFGCSKTMTDQHYERLEFLGDALLSANISRVIFRRYPEASEEDLTNLRSELSSNAVLAGIAKDIGLTKYVRYSDEPFEYKFTERSRDGIYADSLEAVIGAIYVDRGERKARKFIRRHILSRLPAAEHRAEQDNPKTALQKLVHQTHGENPTYEKLEESGNHEDYRCRVGVYVAGEILAEGEGVNKQAASEAAAEEALLRLLNQG